MKIQPLLERVTATIKGYVDKRVGELDAVLKSMPTPKDGKDGRDGIDGKDGQDGRSPTLDEIKSLIPEVKDGRDGTDGKDGKDGRDGVDGRTPTLDEIKALIPAPIRGEKGLDGKDGVDGKNGVDGRDALDITPLPAIDETKSYPRGTYAAHKGGLWRSFEQTKGLKGWECLVNGFNGIEEEQIDERTTLIRCFTSTGTIETTRKSSHMFYRELYKSSVAYERGDVVTWGGNMWVAIKHEGEYKQPGTEGSGWRLAVRAGRDGGRS